MAKLQLALLLGTLLAVGSCAQQPRQNDKTDAARAARYGVSPQLLRTAANYGYLPQARDGKTLFCRDVEAAGSYIAHTQCLDAAQLRSQLTRESGRQGDDQRAMQKAPATCSPLVCGQ